MRYLKYLSMFLFAPISILGAPTNNAQSSLYYQIFSRLVSSHQLLRRESIDDAHSILNAIQSFNPGHDSGEIFHEIFQYSRSLNIRDKMRDRLKNKDLDPGLEDPYPQEQIQIDSLTKEVMRRSKPMTLFSDRDLTELDRIQADDWLEQLNSRTFIPTAESGWVGQIAYRLSVEMTLRWAKRASDLLEKKHDAIPLNLVRGVQDYVLLHMHKVQHNEPDWIIIQSQALPPHFRFPIYDEYLRSLPSPENQVFENAANPSTRPWVFYEFMKELMATGEDWYPIMPILMVKCNKGGEQESTQMIAPLDLHLEFRDGIVSLFQKYAKFYLDQETAESIANFYELYLDRIYNKYDPVSPARGANIMFRGSVFVRLRPVEDNPHFHPSIPFVRTLARLIVGNYHSGLIDMKKAMYLIGRMHDMGHALITDYVDKSHTPQDVLSFRSWVQSFLSKSSNPDSKENLRSRPSAYRGAMVIDLVGETLMNSAEWATQVLASGPFCQDLLISTTRHGFRFPSKKIRKSN